VSEPTARPMPLFYRKPQPLVPVIHDDVRLKDGDYAFAAETNAISVAVVEFTSAMRHYPIVFSEGEAFPVAVLGLGQGNRFVTDGRWAEGAYVPAYVRRYPFVFIEASADSFALALDVGSDRVVNDGGEGIALFADGKPTAFTDSAMAFCREFHSAHLQTQAFVAALVERDLLVPQQADAKLNSGEQRLLGGFRVVDRERFAALPDDEVLEWHRKGWLALIAFHFASLDRFSDLLGRESAAVTDTSPAPAKAPKLKTTAKD
jgi:hypothetical protein